MRIRPLLYTVLFSLLFATACKNEVKKKVVEARAISSVGPIITFTKEKHDFGTIEQGEKVSYSFVFKNEGDSEIVISSATGSCGCTAPSFSKEPIKPGAEGKIDVIFDSEGKSGIVEKTVTVHSNCKPSLKTIRIVANIILPNKQ